MSLDDLNPLIARKDDCDGAAGKDGTSNRHRVLSHDAYERVPDRVALWAEVVEIPGPAR